MQFIGLALHLDRTPGKNFVGPRASAGREAGTRRPTRGTRALLLLGILVFDPRKPAGTWVNSHRHLEPACGISQPFDVLGRKHFVVMGSQSIVYGFIELDPNFSEHNAKAIQDFSYDDRCPFPNLFSTEVSGYQSSTISFAGSLKTISEDWDEWQSRFEALLVTLFARSAKVCVEDEIESDWSLRYVCHDGWDGSVAITLRRWSKWSTDGEGPEGEEVQLT